MNFCTFVVATLLSAPALQAGGASVAVVKIPEVSEKYAKTKDLEAQFDQLRRSFAQQRDEQKSKIERATKALQEEIKPGTDEYRARRKQIAMMEAELQVFVDSEGERIEQGLAYSLRSIFDDIQSAIREIAQQRNIDIVLASDDLPPDAAGSTQTVRQQILLQKVLYWNPKTDITADVVALLNTKYKPQTPPPAAGAPPVNAAPPAAKPQGKP